MPIEVVMPQMGESIAEGTLVRWIKNVGETVNRDEPLFEISTDKVDTEIPSPGEGTLSEIRVQEGETVAVGTVVALLDGAGEKPAPAGAEVADTPVATPAPQAPREAPPAPPLTADASTVVAPAVEPLEEGHVRQRSSPLVRRIAREHDIDLNDVPGTGSGGRVTKKDILAHVASLQVAPQPDVPIAAPLPGPQRGAVASPPPTAAEVRVEPMSTMRSMIAERMVASKFTAPHVTTVHEVDMTAVARMIARHKENFLKLNGAKLTFLPFIMKSVVSGLKEYPIINSTVVGKEIHYYRRINIGVAVSVDWGLLVPVVRDADEKNLVGHARAIADLAGRARSKKLRPDELQGGTFTISNYGVFGSVVATPVINQPQAAILGVGAVVKRPVVLPDSDAIAVRSMCFLSLSFDHRIIDGAVADQFLAHVKDILERCPYDPMES